MTQHTGAPGAVPCCIGTASRLHKHDENNATQKQGDRPAIPW